MKIPIMASYASYRWEPVYRAGWHLMTHTKRGKDVCRYFYPHGDNDNG